MGVIPPVGHPRVLIPPVGHPSGVDPACYTLGVVIHACYTLGVGYSRFMLSDVIPALCSPGVIPAVNAGLGGCGPRGVRDVHNVDNTALTDVERLITVWTERPAQGPWAGRRGATLTRLSVVDAPLTDCSLLTDLGTGPPDPVIPG